MSRACGAQGGAPGAARAVNIRSRPASEPAHETPACRPGGFPSRYVRPPMHRLVISVIVLGSLAAIADAQPATRPTKPPPPPPAVLPAVGAELGITGTA